MKIEEEKTGKEAPKVKWLGLRKFLRRLRDGKFFPRRYFVENWGVLLTLVVLFMAAIAHRNMYMIQLNKISKLEVELANRRSDHLLLKYELADKTNLYEIERAVKRHRMSLQPSTEPKDFVIMEDKE